jgi:hypothetical protein
MRWHEGLTEAPWRSGSGRRNLRRLVVALVACLWAVPAASQCDDEANAARARAWNSGPFRFEITRWSKDFRTRACGAILPGIAQRERNCDATAGAERETIWIGDRRWDKDDAGWRGPYPSIWTHQDRVPAPEAPFSAAQVTCLGRVVVDGRAVNKYEFVRQIADRVWVETIYSEADSRIPVRFETRGRSDANSGAIAIYRHDPAIRIDPPAVDLDQRWAESLRQLSQEAEKGDPACRTEFFAAVQRGRMAAFEFEIKGSSQSIPCCLTGIFVPDAIHHQFTSYPGWLFRETTAEEGRAWAKKSIIMNLFPPSEHVGHVRCLGKVSEDGRDYDAYEYDFYRDSESARTFYGRRSVMVEKGNGFPFRTISVSKTHMRQWIETRRYDAALTIPAPPSQSTSRQPVVSPRADANQWSPGPNPLPFALGPAGAYWPPHGPNWPPFIFMPPADSWPPP